jgi:hypothetical protein
MLTIINYVCTTCAKMVPVRHISPPNSCKGGGSGINEKAGELSNLHTGNSCEAVSQSGGGGFRGNGGWGGG